MKDHGTPLAGTDGWFEEIQHTVDCVAKGAKPALCPIASMEITVKIVQAEVW